MKLYRKTLDRELRKAQAANPQPPPGPTVACAYVRRSHPGGPTIDEQKTAIANKAASQGHTIHRWLVSDSHAAQRYDDRPKLAALAVQAAVWRCPLYIHSAIDAFATSTSFRNCAEFLIANDAPLISATEPHLNTGTTTGRAWADGYYRGAGDHPRDGSTSVRYQTKRAKLDPRRIPYGWRLVKGKLAIHATEMYYRREIWESTSPPGIIAARLAMLDAPRPPGHDRWTARAVYGILRGRRPVPAERQTRLRRATLL